MGYIDSEEKLLNIYFIYEYTVKYDEGPAPDKR